LTLDFGDVDFGGSEQAAIIADWQARRAVGRRTLADEGEFICHLHRDHERPSLYLRQDKGGQIVAAHWPGAELAGSHEIVHVVSDEHRRQVDYLQRAGESEGFEVKTEVHLPTMVTPDAVIYGSQVQMGVEVQRSAITATLAKARTTKARHAGVLPVWFADSQSDPRWLGHVPGVRMNPKTSWATLPHERSVTVVSGVREIVPRHCQDMHNSQCPRRRYGCNQWHADHEPRGVWVDDLAALFPAGQLVPMLYRTLGGREQVFIVTSGDKARYEGMVGRPADLPLRQPARLRRDQDGRIDCTADAGALVVATVASRYCERHNKWMIENVPGSLYCPSCFREDKAARLGRPPNRF